MTTDTFASTALSVLRNALGPDATFRPQQLDSIEALVRQRGRLLVVQRTGWGKSAVYFVATKMLRDQGAGPSIIISPLLALMRDQIDAATRLGLRADTINSSNQAEWDRVERELLDGLIDLLLISPERLNNPAFRERLLAPLARAAGMLVIDEAHCISDWGHDFRPDYRRIVRVLDLMPPTVPVLCTTATANNRVVDDIVSQLGAGLKVLRGPLDRETLSLHVRRLDSQAERLAWLTEWNPTALGSGIVYCLTVADTERVADWLTANGISAVAYSGETDAGLRLEIERRLKNNEVKVVAATSALGMGYDKPDLAFVVHFQSPDSPVAYYQQVGRAGRAIDRAAAVLLAGAEDIDIWRHFLEHSMPLQAHADAVVDFLTDAADWKTQRDIENAVNIRSSQVAGLLKILEVEGAVESDNRRYRRTLRPWAFDAERVTRVRDARLREQDAMRTYADIRDCRMTYLRHALDDPVAADCDRCDNCSHDIAGISIPHARIVQAVEFIRRRPVAIKPRRRWMSANRTGPIADEHRLQPGRALAYLSDPGWGRELLDAKHSGSAVSDGCVNASADLVRRWLGGTPFTLVYVPSLDPARTLVPDFAQRLAVALGVPVSHCVRKIRLTHPQKTMENSAQQLRNVEGAFALSNDVPQGPTLLVDDVWDSGWTMTVIGALLAERGARPTYPFAISRTKG